MTKIERLQALYKNNPTVEAQLPIVFCKGSSLNILTGECGECGKEIPQRFFRGSIYESVGGAWEIDAVGACFRCMKFTPFRMRARMDSKGVIISLLREDEWTTKYMGPLTWQ